MEGITDNYYRLSCFRFHYFFTCVKKKISFFKKYFFLLGFDYVIKRLPPARICFGSSMQRMVLPIDSTQMSPLMRRVTPKSYFIDRKLVTTKKVLKNYFLYISLKL